LALATADLTTAELAARLQTSRKAVAEAILGTRRTKGTKAIPGLLAEGKVARVRGADGFPRWGIVSP
jgi:hypothetical protein